MATQTDFNIENLYAECQRCNNVLNCEKEIRHYFIRGGVPRYATSLRLEMQNAILEEMQRGTYVCEYCSFEVHRCSQCEFMVSFDDEKRQFFERNNWNPTDNDSNWSVELRRLRQRMIRSDYVCEKCFAILEE